MNKILQQAINGTKYSIAGIKYALKNEIAFRCELFLFCILAPLSFYLSNNKIEIVLLISSLVIVIICEIINSAIEAIIDRYSKKIHEYSKAAKDLGSAAVFLAILNTIFVWTIIVLVPCTNKH